MTSLYNRILENVILPAGDLALGTSFISELRRWRRISQLTAEELNRLSVNNLGRLLVFATANVPFYKRFSDGNINDPEAWLKEFSCSGQDKLQHEY